jgi:hypothetical protein
VELHQQRAGLVSTIRVTNPRIPLAQARRVTNGRRVSSYLDAVPIEELARAMNR